MTTGDDMGPHSLSDVVERAIAVSESGSGDARKVSVHDLVGAMGTSSIVALLLLPALVVATPLSGIPGVSGLGGITIALIAVQIVMGRRKAWLPDWVLRRQLSADKMHNAFVKLRKPASHADRHIHRRFHLAAGSAARRLLGLVCTCLGAAMPFLELVPFTSSIAAVAVATLAVALLAGDGLLAMAGFGLIAGIGALILWLV
jgi:hypothetical protein